MPVGRRCLRHRWGRSTPAGRNTVRSRRDGSASRPRTASVSGAVTYTPRSGVNPMASVSYVNASRIYAGNPIPAVNKLNLDIADGEFMVLVGPSGSGKSTALRMLAGLEDVNQGEIHIGGIDVSQQAPQGPRHRDGVPELRALPAHVASPRTWASRSSSRASSKEERETQGARGGQAARPRARTSTASPRRSPVASASASPWAARSCASPASSSWTSRCRTWTPSCASRPAPTSPPCRPAWAPPRSTSPTTRSRP